MSVRRRLVLACAGIVVLAVGGTTAPAQSLVSPDLVVSQVYGGGGNSGATYTHDYIEVFNRGSSTVFLGGFSLQYASATGTGNFGASDSQLFTFPGGALAPGQYVLVQMASNAAVGAPLPSPDFVDSTPINMSGTAGKVALVSGSTSLGCNGGSAPCDPAASARIVDLVGYGNANFFETSPAPTLSNTTAALRALAGCQDTDNNAADFAAATPLPRNSFTPLRFCDADAAPFVSATSPAGGATDVARDANVTITFSEPVDVAGSWYTISCVSSGGHSASAAGGPTTFTLDPDTNFAAGETCTVTVVGGQVSDQDTLDPPDAMTGDHVFSFQTANVSLCGDPATRIPVIQGSGSNAAITGNVSTEGVVVGDFEGSSGLQGFYLQDAAGDDNAATSDGIFVFTGATSRVDAGQLVRVTGFARERFNQTTINGSDSNSAAVTNIIVCGTGSVAPTDVSMPFAAMDFPERYEGMLVRFPQALVISEYFNYERFGELVIAQPLPGESRPFTPTLLEEPGEAATARLLANQLRRITLDDGLSAQNPSVLRHPNGSAFSLSNRFRGGDTVANAVGVLGWDFGRYRIQPTAPADYTVVNPRPAAPGAVGGDVRVAAFNTLNYFLTLDYPTGDARDNKCGPLQNAECRGADSDQPLELTRQRDKLLASLAGLDADVVGLNELENTPGVDAAADLAAGTNGEYASIDTGLIGGDAIRVGLLYKPAAVKPVGVFKVLTSAVDPRFIDRRSRPALAQTFEELATGARFTVVVNHLKSKGSACDGADGFFVDPDIGDQQGNCNLTRKLAAEALVDWIAKDPTGSGDPDFLITGDLNAYAKEDPIDAILAGADHVSGTADDYTNLVAQFLGPYAYSYVFDGMAGYLDHALSNASLTPQVTGLAEWHINADEPDVFDYDTSFKPPAQDALYEPNPYRSSDHDPVLVGLDLKTTYDDMRRMTREFVTHQGIENSLIVKLNAAERAEARGDLEAKADALASYVSALRAQSGKALTAEQAAMLIALASQL